MCPVLTWQRAAATVWRPAIARGGSSLDGALAATGAATPCALHAASQAALSCFSGSPVDMASMLAVSTFGGVAVRVQSAPKRSAARRPLSVAAATKKTPAPPPSRFAAKAAPAESAVAMVCGECGTAAQTPHTARNFHRGSQAGPPRSALPADARAAAASHAPGPRVAGYVYAGPKAFASQPSSYKCPVCKAPKSAFSEKDVGAANAFIPVIAAIVLAAAAGGVYLSKL